jgi:hypothetical protein
MAECIIEDFCVTHTSLNAALLRYFNPIGAHDSGLIGEDPAGIPNNLVPYVTQVLAGRLPHLNVFGDDYNTKDGTGVRDFIHVVDLALGHIASLRYLMTHNPRCVAFNMGRGQGASVMDIVSTFSDITQQRIPYQIKPRRVGDAAEVVATPRLAEEKLGWKATRDLLVMCESAWKWQKQNPLGYKSLASAGVWASEPCLSSLMPLEVSVDIENVGGGQGTSSSSSGKKMVGSGLMGLVPGQPKMDVSGRKKLLAATKSIGEEAGLVVKPTTPLKNVLI